VPRINKGRWCTQNPLARTAIWTSASEGCRGVPASATSGSSPSSSFTLGKHKSATGLRTLAHVSVRSGTPTPQSSRRQQPHLPAFLGTVCRQCPHPGSTCRIRRRLLCLALSRPYKSLSKHAIPRTLTTPLLLSCGAPDSRVDGGQGRLEPIRRLHVDRCLHAPRETANQSDLNTAHVPSKIGPLHEGHLVPPHDGQIITAPVKPGLGRPPTFKHWNPSVQNGVLFAVTNSTPSESQDAS
jgi:hypothetical protein